MTLRTWHNSGSQECLECLQPLARALVRVTTASLDLFPSMTSRTTGPRTRIGRPSTPSRPYNLGSIPPRKMSQDLAALSRTLGIVSAFSARPRRMRTSLSVAIPSSLGSPILPKITRTTSRLLSILAAAPAPHRSRRTLACPLHHIRRLRTSRLQSLPREPLRSISCAQDARLHLWCSSRQSIMARRTCALLFRSRARGRRALPKLLPVRRRV